MSVEIEINRIEGIRLTAEVADVEFCVGVAAGVVDIPADVGVIARNRRVRKRQGSEGVVNAAPFPGRGVPRHRTAGQGQRSGKIDSPAVEFVPVGNLQSDQRYRSVLASPLDMKHTAPAIGVDRDSADGRGVDSNRLADFELFPVQSDLTSGQFRSKRDCVAVRRGLDRFTQGNHTVRRIPFGRVFQCIHNPDLPPGRSYRHRRFHSAGGYGQKGAFFERFKSEFAGADGIAHHGSPDRGKFSETGVIRKDEKNSHRRFSAASAPLHAPPNEPRDTEGNPLGGPLPRGGVIRFWGVSGA